jgi:hypothetical protein
MKLFTGWVLAAGLVFASAAANAQAPEPYSLASDIDGPYAKVDGPYAAVDGPYAAVVPEAPRPAYGPRLLPPLEVYTVVREGGFSPLGIPKQRGLVYTIAVIDRRGNDGRLVIDARTGRIVRFMPASRMGGNLSGLLPTVNFRSGPPPLNARAVPRPPRNVPKVAERTPPAAPPHAGEARPLAANPAPVPAQQTAAAPVKPAETPTTGQAAAAPAPAPAIVEAKPTPQIAPTQDMPKVQGLD